MRKLVRHEGRKMYLLRTNKEKFRDITGQEVYEYMNQGGEYEYRDDSGRMPEERLLINIIEVRDKKNIEKDIEFLNRVIRGGGFSTYIRELENKQNK